MTDDFDDLLGPEPAEPKRKVGRPRGSKNKPKAERTPKTVGGRTDASVVQALQRPVSISFLADALGMDRKTVVKRLANLPPVDYYRGQVGLYSFRQAIECLVTPRVNVAEYVKKMGVGDLPIALQKDVWDARLKEQKWREQAGELWRTEDVLEVLGQAFQTLKTTTQLWIDQVAESQAMTSDARDELAALVDGLQSDLHGALVEMPKNRATESQNAEISDEDGWA